MNITTKFLSHMDSVGLFGEGEINGKPFHIYTLSHQTHIQTSSSSSSGEAATESVGDNDLSPLQTTLFLCPLVRFKVHELKRKETGSTSPGVFPVNVLPHFPTIRSRFDQQVQSLLDSDDNHSDICKLPVAPLFWCNNRKPDHNDFSCGACRSSKLGIGYHLCVTCGEMFHRECVESPLEIKHPSFPFHSLQLHSSFKYTLECISCETDIYNMFYYCPTYESRMHPFCAMKPIPFVIDHPERHPHPLSFYPKQASLVCNVCGLIKASIPTYVCVGCVFAVHQDCIYFPNDIIISRHQHSIYFTSSLPSGNWSCGVCRQKVDHTYGAYTCSSCGEYCVHTRCAVRRDLWQQTDLDLEGVPEDDEPLVWIDDEIILHFSHGHHLKREINRVFDEEKLCQACLLPVDKDSYYSCLDECDFILHEKCAHAPRRIRHAFHPHPLRLKVVTNGYDNKGHFCCDGCGHESCGFVYECSIGGCEFRQDVRCASVSEPFPYQGHEHPLFLVLDLDEYMSGICQICQEDSDENKYCRVLNCIECNYIICFKCATLPYKARYEDDTHFLTFESWGETSGRLTGVIYAKEK